MMPGIKTRLSVTPRKSELTVPDRDDFASATDAPPVLVSACLAGEACRYDGSASAHPVVLRLLAEGRAVSVCPEVLSGLPTPREVVELRAGRALCRSGRDVTEEFLAGARTAVALGLARGCRQAILKSRSPSCGCGVVYDCRFSGILVPGDGLFSALLKELGFSIRTEAELQLREGDRH
jgi:uncharacterized protein YbbK (DUF523 family)